MPFPMNKTKIVCTIGPASQKREIIEQMILAGMDVARLNFSHGDFSSHRKAIANLRAAAKGLKRRLAIMADLPGPKIRIGQFESEPVELRKGDSFTLTTNEIAGNQSRVSVTFSGLPRAVKPGNTLFLDDGLIQLEVVSSEETEVQCLVRIGGQLRSRKGINLPGIDLGVSAFTEDDHRWLAFAMDQGVDAVSQSFVERAADIQAVRETAATMGHHPFVIAKIERSRALDGIEEILQAADGIMIARGDLGVEIPIEQIAVVQKQLMRQANLKGKPVITATEMLESMTNNPRPTRAEATDVANAILDGTDCVMLSAESATGKYPVEAVAMLAEIAAAIEPHNPGHHVRDLLLESPPQGEVQLTDLIARSVETTLQNTSASAVFVPTRSGYTARRIARFRPPVWVVAVSSYEATCQNLQFTFGVYPVSEPDHPENWKEYVRRWLRDHDTKAYLVILTEGPSFKHPEANNRMEIIDLAR